MYTRLVTKMMPKRVLVTENEYELSADKSSILIKAKLDENGKPFVHPIATKVHAVHVTKHPALGGPATIQLVTPDDGQTELPAIPKSKVDMLDDLPYHYRILITRIDVPDRNN